jgi:hypothetical protein
MDSFSNDIIKNKSLKNISIFFISESRLGDEISIKKYDLKNHSFVFAENLNSEKTVLYSMIEWDDISGI